MYNIGGEGQLVVGALFSATLYKLLIDPAHVVPWVAVPLLLLFSVLGGAAWSFLAGWLYIRRGVDVVISTILLNFVAFQLLGWAVAGPLQESGSGLPMTTTIRDGYVLYHPDRQMDLHAGVLIAVLCAVAVQIYLFGSVGGFRLRIVGESPRLARASRISADRYRMQSMLISGAMCGLAGGVEYLGMARQLGVGFSQNWGFLGIPVALLSGLQPISAIAGSLFFGAMFAASDGLSRFTAGGPTLVYIIQAVAVLAVIAIRRIKIPTRSAASAPEP
jgi:simple sugar transport system permease protein